MASLQQRNGSYRVIFRHHDKQHFVPMTRRIFAAVGWWTSTNSLLFARGSTSSP